MSATDDDDRVTPRSSRDDAPGQRSRRAIRLAGGATVVALVLVAVLAFAAGRLSTPMEQTPSTDSAAAGFARDMQVHHAQAVEMAMIVRDRTTDPAVRLLAYDIALSQQHQIGQMYGWLNSWGLPQAGSAAPMAWMAAGAGTTMSGGDMGTAGDPLMTGMASREDMARLAELTGRDAEVLFLRLMTTHHLGGVDMAQAILDRPAPAEVHLLAQAMVDAQNADIAAMATLLAERDAA